MKTSNILLVVFIIIGVGLAFKNNRFSDSSESIEEVSRRLLKWNIQSLSSLPENEQLKGFVNLVMNNSCQELKEADWSFDVVRCRTIQRQLAVSYAKETTAILLDKGYSCEQFFYIFQEDMEVQQMMLGTCILAQLKSGVSCNAINQSYDPTLGSILDLACWKIRMNIDQFSY